MSNRCCGSCTRFPSHHSLHKRTALHVTRRGHRKRRSHRHVYYIYIIGSAAFLKKRRYQSFHSPILLLSYSSVHPSFQSCMHLFHCLICGGSGVFPLRSRSTVPHRQCSRWQKLHLYFHMIISFYRSDSWDRANVQRSERNEWCSGVQKSERNEWCSEEQTGEIMCALKTADVMKCEAEGGVSDLHHHCVWFTLQQLSGDVGEGRGSVCGWGGGVTL